MTDNKIQLRILYFSVEIQTIQIYGTYFKGTFPFIINKCISF